MYFFKKSHEVHLDLRGNLILSHNDSLVKTRVPGAAPKNVHNAKYTENITKLSFFKKWLLVLRCVNFIFGPSEALAPHMFRHGRFSGEPQQKSLIDTTTRRPR